MGYNIAEVTGAAGGGTLGADTWTFEVALNGNSITTVSGDFDEVPIFGGATTEADLGYDFVVDSGSEFGSLSFNATTGEFTFTIDRDAVFDTNANQTVIIFVTGTDTDGVDTDTLTIDLLICVARGTQIRTETGSKPVEHLVPGDMVLTEDGPAKPVRWVGSRKVGAEELRDNPSLRPIKISEGTFGRALPERDLWVSPQHRVLVFGWQAEMLFGAEDVLVPAKALVNGDTIHVDPTIDDVEYFHVLFDQHEIMFTDGLATESFYPSPYALSEISDDARSEIQSLFPDLVSGASVPATARTTLRPSECRVLQSCTWTQPENPKERLVA